jgi:hypothetical protein
MRSKSRPQIMRRIDRDHNENVIDFEDYEDR